MARPLRIEYSGAFYHVMNRGLCRREVFHAEEYAQLFYDVLEEAHERYRLEVHAFCLMGNHYHLCVRTPNANLGKAMQFINGVFTQRYNSLNKVDGPLFRGRYKAILVENDSYFLHLTRYIHLNPVAAGIVQHPKEYPWSSYKFLNKSNRPVWLYFEEIFKNFVNVDPIQGYERFVLDGMSSELKYRDKLEAFPILGSPNFVEQMKNEIPKPAPREIPDATRVIESTVIDIADIINTVAQYYKVDSRTMLDAKRVGNLPRRVATYLAVQMSGKSQTTIAEYFNKDSYWTVSKIYYRTQSEIKENIDMLQDICNIKNLLRRGVRSGIRTCPNSRSDPFL